MLPAQRTDGRQYAASTIVYAQSSATAVNIVIVGRHLDVARYRTAGLLANG